MTRYDEAGPARIIRRTEDGRWTPVGGPLPPLEDDGLHQSTPEAHAVTWWTFPREPVLHGGDVMLHRERAWRLLDRCGA